MSMKHVQHKLVVAVLAILLAGLVGAGLTGTDVQARGEDDPLPTPAPPGDGGDYGHGEHCNLPGIVVNFSTIPIKILGDTYVNGRLTWVQKTLYPGQRSSQHYCDTDYIGHYTLQWKFGDRIVQPKKWSPYIFNTTYVCRNHTVNREASFRCVFAHYNWGPRT